MNCIGVIKILRVPGLAIVKTDLVIPRHLGRVTVRGIGLGEISQKWNSVRLDHAEVNAHIV